LHHQDTLQAGWAAEEVLTAAAARRVLDPACAGAEPLRLVQHAGGFNGTAAVTAAHLMGKRRRWSRAGGGCTAMVIEADVLLTANAARDACAYYGAEAFDAVLHGALPAPIAAAAAAFAAGGRASVGGRGGGGDGGGVPEV